jgi:hypothetical protein
MMLDGLKGMPADDDLVTKCVGVKYCYDHQGRLTLCKGRVI